MHLGKLRPREARPIVRQLVTGQQLTPGPASTLVPALPTLAAPLQVGRTWLPAPPVPSCLTGPCPEPPKCLSCCGKSFPVTALSSNTAHSSRTGMGFLFPGPFPKISNPGQASWCQEEPRAGGPVAASGSGGVILSCRTLGRLLNLSEHICSSAK